MKISKKEFHTILTSIMLIAWAFLFPGFYKYVNFDPTESRMQIYMVFMPVVYFFCFIFFSLGCYFIYNLVKERLIVSGDKKND